MADNRTFVKVILVVLAVVAVLWVIGFVSLRREAREDVRRGN